MKVTKTEARLRLDMYSNEFNEFINKYPTAIELITKGILCEKLMNADVIENLIKKPKKEEK